MNEKEFEQAKPDIQSDYIFFFVCKIHTIDMFFLLFLGIRLKNRARFLYF